MGQQPKSILNKNISQCSLLKELKFDLHKF